MAQRPQSELEKLIRSHAASGGDDEWFRFQDENDQWTVSYSWRSALSMIQRTANGLLALGAGPGSRIALMMHNRPEYVWSHFATLMIGATTIPVNVRQRGAGLHHILKDSNADFAICDGELQSVLGSWGDIGGITLVSADSAPLQPGFHAFEELLGAPDKEPRVAIQGKPAMDGIRYTSGTTGPPKGVVVTHFDLIPFADIIGASGIQRGETIYNSLPIYHANGMSSITYSIILRCRSAIATRFTASRIWDHCREMNAVQFNTVGGMIRMLLNQPERPDDADNPVRVVFSSGCAATDWNAFQDRFKVKLVESYGSADLPSLLLNRDGRVGSIGKPLGEFEYAIVNSGDQPLGPNQVGEIVVRHPAGRLSYYHNQPEATDKAWRGGWFHTGDRGTCDEAGYFYYKGRISESMRRRGENVSSWEIETPLAVHPKIADVAVHAVPSEIGEDEIKAVVVPADDSLTPSEFWAYCESCLPKYAVPRYLEYLDEIPKTGTERPQYLILKERGIGDATLDRERYAPDGPSVALPGERRS